MAKEGRRRESEEIAKGRMGRPKVRAEGTEVSWDTIGESQTQAERDKGKEKRDSKSAGGHSEEN